MRGFWRTLVYCIIRALLFVELCKAELLVVPCNPWLLQIALHTLQKKDWQACICWVTASSPEVLLLHVLVWISQWWNICRAVPEALCRGVPLLRNLWFPDCGSKPWPCIHCMSVIFSRGVALWPSKWAVASYMRWNGTEVCCGIKVTFGFSIMEAGVAIAIYTIRKWNSYLSYQLYNWLYN